MVREADCPASDPEFCDKPEMIGTRSARGRPYMSPASIKKLPGHAMMRARRAGTRTRGRVQGQRTVAVDYAAARSSTSKPSWRRR